MGLYYRLTISTDEEKSSAIYTAIVTYMKHLGVKAKTADNKKSKANFFRKKISGTKKPEEAIKPRKGFSILDPARWNRGDSHYSDYRQPKPEGEGTSTPLFSSYQLCSNAWHPVYPSIPSDQEAT